MPIMLIQVNKCFLLYHLSLLIDRVEFFSHFQHSFPSFFLDYLYFCQVLGSVGLPGGILQHQVKVPGILHLLSSSYYFSVLMGFTANLCKEWKSWIEQQFFVYCRLRLEVQVELNIEYDFATSYLTYLGPIWAQRLDVPTTCIYQQKLAGIWTIILKYNWSALTANLVFGLTCWLVMWEL